MKKSIIICVIVLLLAALGIYVFKIQPQNKELDAIRNMVIEDVDLNTIDDGVYNGSFEYGSFTYAVEVVMENHSIVQINVTSNRDSSHAKKAEEIISVVLNKQAINADAVSGATTTSKALLKAIENALTSGMD